jgi:hypothetical protein
MVHGAFTLSGSDDDGNTPKGPRPFEAADRRVLLRLLAATIDRVFVADDTNNGCGAMDISAVVDSSSNGRYRYNVMIFIIMLIFDFA